MEDSDSMESSTAVVYTPGQEAHNGKPAGPFTTNPIGTVAPPPRDGDGKLPLVIGLSVMAGVGFLIAIICIYVVCIRRRKKLVECEKEKTAIDTENADNNQNAQRGGRHTSGNEITFNHLERASKMKRNTYNEYEQGASNFVTSISHNEEEEDLAKYMIDDELAEYDKLGHKKVSPSKGTTSDDAGYDHMPQGAAAVTVIDSSGKVTKSGKDLAKYMADNDMLEYDKLGNKNISPSKVTTSDDAGYDHFANPGDTVTIIDPAGNVVKQKAPKRKARTTKGEESPYDLALSDEGLHVNGEYEYIGDEEAAYDLAKGENNNGDVYDVAADVNRVKPIKTLLKTIVDPGKGEEDSEYAYIPDISDEHDIAADVETNESPYELAKDNDQSDKDGAYDVAPVVKSVKPALPLPNSSNVKNNVYVVASSGPEYVLPKDIDDPAIVAKEPVDKCEYDVLGDPNDDVYDVPADVNSVESPYTTAEDTGNILGERESEPAEYDSIGNKDSFLKESIDDGGYDHIPKLDSKVIVVGLRKSGIKDIDQHGKVMDAVEEEFPEDVVEKKEENPYLLAADDDTSTGQGIVTDESPYCLAGEVENPYTLAEDGDNIDENHVTPGLAGNDEETPYDVAVDVRQDRLEHKASHEDIQGMESTEEQKEGYYNTSEVLKRVKLNGHLQEGALDTRKVTSRILVEENDLYDKSPDTFPKLIRNDSYESWQPSPDNNPKVKVIVVENSLYDKATI